MATSQFKASRRGSATEDDESSAPATLKPLSSWTEPRGSQPPRTVGGGGVGPSAGYTNTSSTICGRKLSDAASMTGLSHSSSTLSSMGVSTMGDSIRSGGPITATREESTATGGGGNTTQGRFAQPFTGGFPFVPLPPPSAVPVAPAFPRILSLEDIVITSSRQHSPVYSGGASCGGDSADFLTHRAPPDDHLVPPTYSSSLSRLASMDDVGSAALTSPTTPHGSLTAHPGKRCSPLTEHSFPFPGTQNESSTGASGSGLGPRGSGSAYIYGAIGKRRVG